MPTIKQRIAVEKLSEIIRNSQGKKTITIGRILREAGYSESVCKAPQRVTQRKGWQELIKEYFPDDLLVKKHRELLNKKEIVTYKGTYKKTDQPHTDVKYALEMLYKLKKKYDEFVREPSEIDLMTDEEIDKELVTLFWKQYGKDMFSKFGLK